MHRSHGTNSLEGCRERSGGEFWGSTELAQCPCATCPSGLPSARGHIRIGVRRYFQIPSSAAPWATVRKECLGAQERSACAVLWHRSRRVLSQRALGKAGPMCCCPGGAPQVNYPQVNPPTAQQQVAGGLPQP